MGWGRAWVAVGMATVAVLSTVGGVLTSGALTATTAGATTPGCGGPKNLPSSGSELGVGGVLTSGQCLASPSDQYEFIMQTDGDLVEYFNAGGGESVWANNTDGHPGDHVVMQSDGNLVVYTANGTSLWTSGSQGTPGASLTLQDDGNVVVYGTNTSGAYPSWATNTVGARGHVLLANQTLQPNQYLVHSDYKLQMSPSGVLTLYSLQPYACPLWSAPTITGTATTASGYSVTPQSGSYLLLDNSGNLDLDAPNNPTPWWSASQTSTWTGGTAGSSGDYLTLQSDGNLVLYAPGGGVRWQSGTNDLRGFALCSGTKLQAGQYLVPWVEYPDGQTRAFTVPAPADHAVGHNEIKGSLVMQGTCNLVFYATRTGPVAWASNTNKGTNGHLYPGSQTPSSPYYGCYAEMQTDGNLVVEAPNDGKTGTALWQSGTKQTSTVPFNLGAIGPYMTVPLYNVTSTKGRAPFVLSTHGVTLGNPSPASESKVLQILGYVFDALSTLLTFVGGPLGAVFDALGTALSLVGIGVAIGTTAATGVGAARTSVATGQDAPSTSPSATCGTGLPSSGSSLPTGLLTQGQCLISPNGQYELVMQADGNLVLYYQSQSDPIWNSNTAGNPGAFLRLQGNGYLGVINSANTTTLFYAPNSQGTPNPDLVLQDDGNLVLYGSPGDGTGPHAVWSTGVASTVIGTCSAASPATGNAGTVITSGGCLYSPNHQYELVMQADGNLVLYYLPLNDPIWDSNTAGNPGAFLRLQSNGFLGVLNSTNTTTLFYAPRSVNTANPTLALGNSGNLILYGNNSTPSTPALPYAIWSTNTANLRGTSLPSGSTLTPGQYLESPNGTYKLSMGTTGLLELSYLTRPASTAGSYFCPMWSRPYNTTSIYYLGTKGPSYQPTLNAGSYLDMQSDGNLVVYPGTSSGATIGLSNTPTDAGAYLRVQNDGNVVVYTKNGSTALWSSGTNADRGPALCTNGTLHAGQYLTQVGFPNQTTKQVLRMTTSCQLTFDENTDPTNQYTETSVWRSTPALSGVAATGCYAVMQGTGNLVIYAPGDGNKAIWASNTEQATGPPNLVENLGPYSLVNPGTAGEIITDSGKYLWTEPASPTSKKAAADGSTANSALQVLLQVLVFALAL